MLRASKSLTDHRVRAFQKLPDCAECPARTLTHTLTHTHTRTPTPSAPPAAPSSRAWMAVYLPAVWHRGACCFLYKLPPEQSKLACERVSPHLQEQCCPGSREADDKTYF